MAGETQALNQQPPISAPLVLPSRQVLRAQADCRACSMDSGCMRILVVDDEVTILTLLSGYLTMKGFNVRAAQTTPEALGCIETWAPDLILTDVWMPCGGAARILDYLDCRKARPVVLLMTGSELEWAQRAVRVGRAEAALQKPFQLKVVEDMLTQISNRASQ